MLHKIYSNKLACSVIDTAVALLIINSSTEILTHWEHLHVITLYTETLMFYRSTKSRVCVGERGIT